MPPEIAGAGDEHALQADAGPPPALERLAHELPRAVGEDDVDEQKQRPDGLRHFVHARVLERVRHVVGLEVQRADDAEHHREDAADEHGEEIVDARAPSAQTVEPLHLERDRRRAAAMNGSMSEYCANGGMPFVTGMRSAMTSRSGRK